MTRRVKGNLNTRNSSINGATNKNGLRLNFLTKICSLLSHLYYTTDPYVVTCGTRFVTHLMPVYW